jgi:ribosomal protein S18 acetylase RimI-like enzyme
MTNGNGTASRDCRFLSEDYFPRLYETFIEAFSDYVVPFALTETQFRNHIILNAVDLARTVGCIENDRLIGFSLNGFGDWQGKPTVYDAGTGVVPDRRRGGVSAAMFDLMLPAFRAAGAEQFLLEVVTSNKGAINLYEKLDFHAGRELALLQCDSRITLPAEAPPPDLEIREIENPDWSLLTTFWDGRPSWQNSIEAVKRSRKVKRILGAYVEGRCVGYIVFSSRFGRVAQIAVDKTKRGRGIGTALTAAMQNETADGFSMQVINIDKAITSAIDFFVGRGFYERLSQYEMIMPM